MREVECGLDDLAIHDALGQAQPCDVAMFKTGESVLAVRCRLGWDVHDVNVLR